MPHSKDVIYEEPPETIVLGNGLRPASENSYWDPLSQPAIKIEKLSKCFISQFLRKRKWAVRNVSFDVRKGEIFGLLGPNGAGKTTTLKLLAGLIFPSEGTGSILGFSLGDAEGRSRMGFLPENQSFYERVSVKSFLDFSAQLLGVPKKKRKEKIEELISVLDLGDWTAQEIRKLSRGTVQRVGIAQALIGEPEVLILDEPMSSLDPIGRKEVRNLLLSLSQSGVTILFSTHILPDVETLCDRVGIMRNGELVRILHMNELTENSSFKGQKLEEFFVREVVGV